MQIDRPFLHQLFLPVFAGVLSATFPVFAESESGDSPVEATVAESGDFENAISEPPSGDFHFFLPAWMVGLEGTLGVRGLDAGIDAGFFSDILPNADMLALGGLEARRGKLGFIIQGLYVNASVGGTPPGPLLSNIDVGVELVLAEGAVAWRVFENDRGWLDLIGGARYKYLGADMGLRIDSAGVEQVGRNLSSEVIDRAVAVAREEVDARLPALLANLRGPASEAVRQRVEDRINGIGDRLPGVRETIRERIDDRMGTSGPGFGNLVADSPAIRDAIREYARAQADARIEEARAEASAARAGIRRKADQRLARAEAKLARTLKREIENRIPESLSGSNEWIDPFIGLRGRCDLSEDWYLAVQADIGGFGINSDLTWNLFGALGCQITDRASIELGYRYYRVDYRDGDFVFDMAAKGPFLGVGIDF